MTRTLKDLEPRSTSGEVLLTHRARWKNQSGSLGRTVGRGGITAGAEEGVD